MPVIVLATLLDTYILPAASMAMPIGSSSFVSARVSIRTGFGCHTQTWGEHRDAADADVIGYAKIQGLESGASCHGL